jgi:general nucleoside transport system permease protein
VLPVASVLLAFVAGAILIVIQGKNPGLAAKAIFDGSLNGTEAFGRTLDKSTPLILTGVAVIVALKAGLFNIGAEGQLVMGSIMAAYVGYRFNLPPVIHVPFALIVGAIFGALTASIAGVLKATRNVHEVISTIMLNTIVANLTDYLAGEPWQMKNQAVTRTAPILKSAKIGRIFDLPVGFFVSVAVALAAWFLVTRTTSGFRMNTVGLNKHAAHYAGMSVKRTTILAMTLSGALAGFAGALQVQGVTGYFDPNSGSGLGFDGITIALLARVSPRAAIPSALLIGALRASNTKLQADALLAPEIIDGILGIILLLVAAPVIVRWVLRMRKGDVGEQIQLTQGWGA